MVEIRAFSDNSMDLHIYKALVSCMGHLLLLMQQGSDTPGFDSIHEFLLSNMHSRFLNLVHSVGYFSP